MNPCPKNRQPEHNSATTSTSTPEQPNALQFQDQEQETEKISTLTVELPSTHQDFDNDDEPTTPKSLDSKISIPTTCPPAPRKPKTVSMSYKRKTPSFHRISVDLMVKINAMFAPVEVVVVPDIMAGDLDAGDRVKKVKKADVTTGL